MAKSYPLSNVDTAWYQMEEPTNLMMATGVLLFEDPLPLKTVKQLLTVRLLKYQRFKMKVVESNLPLANPRWEEDETFDLDSHITHVGLPAPGDQTALQNLASTLISMPLDFSKPLWHATLVDNVQGGSALFFRFHHCMLDGIAGIHVLLDLTDEAPTAPIERESDRPRDANTNNARANLLKPAEQLFKTGRKLAETMYEESMEAVLNPSAALDKAQDRAQTAAELAAKGVTATGKLLLLPPDPPTPLKGKLGVQKRAVWTKPLPLANIKAISKAMNSKINDVLLSAMAGALRRYLLSQSFDITNLNLRAAVPVNLRPLDRAAELGNEFGLVILSLPVGIADPVERMRELKRRMDEIKGSPEALITFGILNILGVTPTQFAEQFLNLMGAKATMVATNVPGPRQTLYMAGNKLTNMMFWVPQSGRLGVGISILSYDGKVTLGVATDAGLVNDPEKILQGFYDEYDSLMALVPIADMGKSPETSPSNQGQQCLALTKSGRQCRNQPRAGSPYCHIHQEKAVPMPIDG